MLDRLRRLKPIDTLFRALEAYTSLGEQYPWAKRGLNALVGLVLGTWAYAAESWLPLAIMIGLVVFVALSLLPAAVSQPANSGRPAAASASPRPPQSDAAYLEVLRSIQLDLALLLHFAVDQATDALLDNLIKSAPKYDGLADETDTIIRHERLQEVGNYINKCSSSFTSTHRGESMRSVLTNAGFAAEAEVKKIPLNDLPPHLDQLDLLQCIKLERMCDRLIAFLVSQRAEKQEQILHQRPRLAERMSDRES